MLQNKRQVTESSNRLEPLKLETNPWWAVDLGGPTTVYKVNFTNRGDGLGMWLFSLAFLPRDAL